MTHRRPPPTALRIVRGHTAPVRGQPKYTLPVPPRAAHTATSGNARASSPEPNLITPPPPTYSPPTTCASAPTTPRINKDGVKLPLVGPWDVSRSFAKSGFDIDRVLEPPRPAAISPGAGPAW